MPFATRYRTVTVQGLEVFYREAGDPSRPTLVLLHGFPASSFMFRELIGALADRFHLVAPDHVGFGRSAMPAVDEFDYTFERLSEITLAFLDELGLDRFALYVQDYGAPIGLRIASRHPDRVTALISQNGNAYVDGLHAVLGRAVRVRARRRRRTRRRRGRAWIPTGRSGSTRTACPRSAASGWRRTRGSSTRPPWTARATARSSSRSSATTRRTSTSTRPSRSTSARTEPPALVAWG